MSWNTNRYFGNRNKFYSQMYFAPQLFGNSPETLWIAKRFQVPWTIKNEAIACPVAVYIETNWHRSWKTFDIKKSLSAFHKDFKIIQIIRKERMEVQYSQDPVALSNFMASIGRDVNIHISHILRSISGWMFRWNSKKLIIKGICSVNRDFTW